jgi:O-antigen ligase
MSSISRTWQSAAVITAEDVPSREAVVQNEPAIRSRKVRESDLYLVFHYVLLVYLFMYVSRLPELVSWLHIGILLQPILLVGLVLTKRTRAILEMRSSRWLIAFTVWIAICVPFSFWPGGSFTVFVSALQSLLLVAFILAFVRSLQDVMRALTTVGLASGVIALLSIRSSSDIDNRMGLGGSASLGDPNYFAIYLLVGVALLCITASQSRGWLRLCAIALIPINLAATVRSGSRGGFLALLVGLVMLLVYGSAKQRTVIVSSCLLGVLVAAFWLPATIQQRLTNWLSPTGFSVFFTGERPTEFSANRGITTAEGSTEARMYVMRRSLILTAKHPFFGVGPDQFMGAEAADANAHGVHPAWHVAHNTYAEFSAELGIPGFILFVGALLGSYRGLSAIRKSGPTGRIRQMGLFLQTAYVMLMVGAFFLTLGYGGLLFVVIGLSGAFQSAVHRYAKEARTASLQPQMSVAV